MSPKVAASRFLGGLRPGRSQQLTQSLTHNNVLTRLQGHGYDLKLILPARPLSMFVGNLDQNVTRVVIAHHCDAWCTVKQLLHAILGVIAPRLLVPRDIKR